MVRTHESDEEDFMDLDVAAGWKIAKDVPMNYNLHIHFCLSRTVQVLFHTVFDELFYSCLQKAP